MSTSRQSARGKRGNPIVVFVASLLVVSFVYYLNECSVPEPPKLPEFEELPRPDSFERGEPREVKVGRFTRLDGCELQEHPRKNDGDSFLIRHGGKVHHFRLYFVDCPEKERHEKNGARLAEQGKYFGGLGEAATVEIGLRGRDASLYLLRNYPFTVYTFWEPVYDPSRRYALIEITDADKQKAYLHEILIGFGLARIHTKGTDLPDGTRWQEQKSRLQELEREATAARRGAWE